MALRASEEYRSHHIFLKNLFTHLTNFMTAVFRGRNLDLTVLYTSRAFWAPGTYSITVKTNWHFVPKGFLQVLVQYFTWKVVNSQNISMNYFWISCYLKKNNYVLCSSSPLCNIQVIGVRMRYFHSIKNLWSLCSVCPIQSSEVSMFSP